MSTRLLHQPLEPMSSDAKYCEANDRETEIWRSGRRPSTAMDVWDCFLLTSDVAPGPVYLVDAPRNSTSQ
jgi:hypothetical protein